MGSKRDPEFGNRVTDVYPRTDVLVDAAAAARDLLAHPGWSVLSDLLDATAAKAEAELDGRLLESRAAYARAHGRLWGLRAAPALMEALLDKADDRLRAEREREDAGETASRGAV